MIRGSLAKRYARALMAIGQEQGIYERLGAELDQVAGMAADNETFRQVIKTPIISRGDREKILEEIAKLMDAHDVSLRFLKLLNEKGRLAQLENIALAYRDLADEAEGRVRASVTSARDLSPESESSIKEALAKLTGKSVIMSVEVDESLIGGIVTRVAGKLLDGSVKTQLKAVEERLKSEGAE